MNSTVSLKSQVLALMLLVITSISCNQSKNDINSRKNMEIKWTKLSTNGLQDNLSKGVSASFAALLEGKLIVGGGANFPDKLGFEGGSKAFYDEILLYDEVNEAWEVVNHLPSPTAYGVSVPLSDGALWIVGNNADESLNTTYHISLNSNKEVVLRRFLNLPVTIDNFSGCSIGDIVFVAGGVENGKPSNSIYSINTKTDTEWNTPRSYQL